MDDKEWRVRGEFKRTLPVLVAGVLWVGNVLSAQNHECNCNYCLATSHNAAEQLPKAPLSELCLGCRPDRGSPNKHRVDIVPSKGVPEHFHGTGGYLMLLRASPFEVALSAR
ncbi:MAG TPA: hypothetical protein VEI28_06670 [Thermodesulfovibrionales bacterium]|nr:hypothetical protein [Thermodesulfovibrionales bacterium]